LGDDKNLDLKFTLVAGGGGLEVPDVGFDGQHTILVFSKHVDL
jgi:hypothetical protein